MNGIRELQGEKIGRFLFEKNNCLILRRMWGVFFFFRSEHQVNVQSTANVPLHIDRIQLRDQHQTTNYKPPFSPPACCFHRWAICKIFRFFATDSPSSGNR